MNTTATTAPATAEKKTRKVSDRVVLDHDGKPQEEWIDAGGIRYEILNADYAAQVMFRDLPDAIKNGAMAFGLLTQAGNVTNTVRNSQEGKGMSESELLAAQQTALETWLEQLLAGNWTGAKGEFEAGLSTLAAGFAAVRREAGDYITDDEALEKLKAAPKEKRDAIRKNAKVAAAVARIIAERKAAAAANSAEMPDL